MKKNRSGRDLQAQWEQAVERASEDRRSDSELESEALNDAAGLHVQSGVRAGGWTHTCSCGGSCATQCACSAPG